MYWLNLRLVVLVCVHIDTEIVTISHIVSIVHIFLPVSLERQLFSAYLQYCLSEIKISHHQIESILPLSFIAYDDKCSKKHLP